MRGTQQHTSRRGWSCASPLTSSAAHGCRRACCRSPSCDHTGRTVLVVVPKRGLRRVQTLLCVLPARGATIDGASGAPGSILATGSQHQTRADLHNSGRRRESIAQTQLIFIYHWCPKDMTILAVQSSSYMQGSGTRARRTGVCCYNFEPTGGCHARNDTSCDYRNGRRNALRT